VDDEGYAWDSEEKKQQYNPETFKRLADGETIDPIKP
jgi:hypothetical protein